MKLHFKKGLNNFGDDLNDSLWSLIRPELFDDNSDELFVGIGTILGLHIPNAKKVVIFSSGFGYGKLPLDRSHWNITCVRGPLTAHALGLSADLAITEEESLYTNYHSHPTGCS